MKSAISLILLFLLSSCTPKRDDVAKPKNAYDLLKDDEYWTLVFCDAFTDGGSITLSFLGRDGNIIHLWADNSLNEKSTRRKFFLQRTYNDPDAVEVIPESEIEKRVIDLLANYQRRPFVTIPDTYAQEIIAMLRDRNRPFAVGGVLLKSPGLKPPE